MIVCWNAWPMCSVPVTFGGGSRMLYGVPSPDGRKQPRRSHSAYHFASIDPGSKLFSMRVRRSAWPPALVGEGTGYSSKRRSRHRHGVRASPEPPRTRSGMFPSGDAIACDVAVQGGAFLHAAASIGPVRMRIVRNGTSSRGARSAPGGGRLHVVLAHLEASGPVGFPAFARAGAVGLVGGHHFEHALEQARSTLV